MYKTFNFIRYLKNQIEWSAKTFGPTYRPKGLIDHITKELKEIEQEPHDLSEWIDIIILGIDGAWRSGHNSYDIAKALKNKQNINKNRKWPDWRTVDPNKAIEHEREEK